MAAEQNRCPEPQFLLGGSSLSIAVQLGRLASHRLVSSRYVQRSLTQDMTPGTRPACTARRARPTATSGPSLFTFLSPAAFFLTTTSIWWALYNLVIVVTTFLPLLTAHLNGWKLFPCQLFPRRTVHELLFSTELPIFGYLVRSLPIADHNLQ
jgi:hypothetical protein